VTISFSRRGLKQSKATNLGSNFI